MVADHVISTSVISFSLCCLSHVHTASPCSDLQLVAVITLIVQNLTILRKPRMRNCLNLFICTERLTYQKLGLLDDGVEHRGDQAIIQIQQVYEVFQR